MNNLSHRWWTGPWQHCSVTCGDDGVRKRTVLCTRSHGPNHQVNKKHTLIVIQIQFNSNGGLLANHIYTILVLPLKEI